MIFQPYKIVPGTEILHSNTDCYELTDEVEGMSYRAELQVDNGGVYMEYSEKKTDEKSKLFTECMSIANKELAIVVARRILELYGVEK